MMSLPSLSIRSSKRTNMDLMRFLLETTFAPTNTDRYEPEDEQADTGT